MPRRRMAADTTQLSEKETTTCFCGGTDFDYSFARFPMTHASRCKNCGFEHRCELKLTTPKATPTTAQPEDPPFGFPPFWY